MTARIVDQVIERVPIDSVLPHPQNPRRGNLEVISNSIRDNGFYGAIVVQKSSRTIVAGAHRWQAEKDAGADAIDAIMIDVDDATARRIMLADNRTSDLAGYDDKSLAACMEALIRSEDGLTGSAFSEEDYQAALSRLDIQTRIQATPEIDRSIVVGVYRPHVDKDKFDAWLRNLESECGGSSLVVAELRTRLGMLFA